MTWLRQWKGRDVLKLLAVVLPALLFVGAGLGWIVHEYHRQAGEQALDRANVTAMKFYRETQSALNDLSSRAAKRAKAQRTLENRLASFVAQRGDSDAPFPLATAAFAVPSNGRYIVSSGFPFFGVTLTRTSAILATRPPAKQ